MRTTARILTVLSLLVVGSLAMPGAAAVTMPLPQPDWRAAYDAAVVASGAFTPGTTVTLDVRNEARSESLVMTINPDGSLTGERITKDGLDRIRCVRVDRCWEQSALLFRNARWHLLPPGSVTYLPSTEYWSSDVMNLPWPEVAVYIIDTPEDGSATTYLVGMGDESNAFMTAAWFGERAVTARDMIVVGGSLVSDSLSTAMGSPERTAVTAPAKATIGKPARLADYWKVPINRS